MATLLQSGVITIDCGSHGMRGPDFIKRRGLWCINDANLTSETLCRTYSKREDFCQLNQPWFALFPIGLQFSQFNYVTSKSLKCYACQGGKCDVLQTLLPVEIQTQIKSCFQKNFVAKRKLVLYWADYVPHSMQVPYRAFLLYYHQKSLMIHIFHLRTILITHFYQDNVRITRVSFLR